MGKLDDVPTFQDLEIVFGNVLSTILGFAAIALFVMLVMGGFKYITSGGDPKAVEGAKKTISSAITGVFLVALSIIILRVIGVISGADFDTFRIFLRN